MTPFPQPTRSCLVPIDRNGDLRRLGQFPDRATADAAMADWLTRTDRIADDAGFVLPVLGLGRPATEG